MRCGVARFSDELRVLWADCMSRPELAWRAWRAWPGVDLPATGLSGVGLGFGNGMDWERGDWWVWLCGSGMGWVR